MSKFLLALFVAITLHLQYRLWFGDASIGQILEYQQRLDALTEQANEKNERNEALYAEIEDIKNGSDAMEERARYELGMIKDNETFFQVLE